MKKILKLSLLSFLLVGIGSSIVRKVNSQLENPLIIKDSSFLGADFSSNIYTYELEKKFNDTPNTIESWVRLDKLAIGEKGGVIFGNYEYYNYSYVNLEINENRNVVLRWNCDEVVVTFDEYQVAKNIWVHLSVVRDLSKEEFALYVNGIKTQIVKTKMGSTPSNTYRYIVGGDWANWRADKNIFNGEIGQVTVYSSSLNEREVYQDYIAENKISNENRENLLFNAEFTMNCLEGIDTSKNKNNASIRSNDYFYKGDVYEAKDYSLAIIPDPQIMTHWYQGNVDSISKYIIDKHETHNIAMTLCVGDNADGVNASYPQYDMDYQLKAIKEEYTKLDIAGIRWATTPGNHDYDDNFTATRNLTYYNKHFSYDEIKEYDYYGGVYKPGQTQNAFYLFEEAGVPYLVISLEFGADDLMLEWASDVVESYPERRVIVITHAYIGGTGEIIGTKGTHSPDTYGATSKIQVNSPQKIFDKFISQHENMFMVFSGHVPSDDIFLCESEGIHGNIIMQFGIDAQGIMSTGCESLVSLLTFDEINQKVYVNYESTTTRELFNTHNQFEFSFEGKTNILSSTYYDEDGNLYDEYK